MALALAEEAALGMRRNHGIFWFAAKDGICGISVPNSGILDLFHITKQTMEDTETLMTLILPNMLETMAMAVFLCRLVSRLSLDTD